MKKVDRLRWIQERFGDEFVLLYHACTTWREIAAAVRDFERRGRTWGLRTDSRGGTSQGYHLPFLHHGDLASAYGIWSEHGRKLVYIVCENVLRVFCHGVAIPTDTEHVFFEINDREPSIAQRAMYDCPHNLRRFFLGPSGFAIFSGNIYRCLAPSDGRLYCLHTVYELALCTPRVDEITFTVRAPDRRLIIW